MDLVDQASHSSGSTQLDFHICSPFINSSLLDSHFYGFTINIYQLYVHMNSHSHSFGISFTACHRGNVLPWERFPVGAFSRGKTSYHGSPEGDLLGDASAVHSLHVTSGTCTLHDWPGVTCCDPWR